MGVTKPSTVFAGQSFKLANFGTTQTVSIDCTRDPTHPPPSVCAGTSSGPTYTSAAPTEIALTSLSFPVRVFELDGNLAPASEVPCLVCGLGDHWKFAIPPRAGNTSASIAPRRFKVMTMIGQVSALWPSDGNFPAAPPFVDTTLNRISFTGTRGGSSTGYTVHNTHTLPNGTVLDTCIREATIAPYRALTAVHLRIPGAIMSDYATAPTQLGVPVTLIHSQSFGNTLWDRVEGVLP